MITIAKKVAGEKLELLDKISPGIWIHLTNPSDSEVETVIAATNIPEELIKAALDEEESAHIEYEEKFRLITIDIPVIEDGDNNIRYSTTPLAIITGGSHIVTVCLKDTTVIDDFLQARTRDFSTTNKIDFILKILYRNAQRYLTCLKQIDKASHRIQSALHKSTKNKEIIQLLELETSLVFFSTSLKSNQAVIDRMAKMDEIKDNKENNELLEDVHIENYQAIEMSSIYRDILAGTMDAFASIINNNVNIIMKLLTIITIVLSISSVVSGFFGMNVMIPLQNKPWAFWVIVSGTILLAIGIAWLIVNRTKRIK